MKTITRIILAILTMCAGLFIGGFMLLYINQLLALPFFVTCAYLAWQILIK